MIIDISPDLKAVFELLAKDAGITFSQLASIALEEQVMERRVLKDYVRKKVDQALKDHFTLIADIVCPTLAPRPGKKGKKRMPN